MRLLCATTFLLMLALPVAAADRVRLATGEWPPYASASLPHGGVATRIITAAFAEAGIDVEYSYLSWKRGYEVARQGKLDGAILWAEADKADVDFLSTDPIMTGSVVLFHHTETPIENTDPASLRGYRLALPDGYGYEQIPAYIKLVKASGYKPVTVADDQQGLAALLNNRIDVYPIDRLVGLYLLINGQHPDWQARLTYQPKPVALEPLGVLIHRRKPHAAEWVARFNAGLAALRRRGLVARWLAETEASLLPQDAAQAKPAAPPNPTSH
jgi:polar amino acid transport system substrate-binding protein